MPTRPGINPNFDITAFPPLDQRAIRRLAQHFYVTRVADSVQVGNSNYRSFLMRPADEISVVLNVEREIVVLIADYETFEARTLQAFDRLFEQFEDVRIDRSFRILISGDQDIESLIRHYLAQDPEYPIVIPFHYSDFQQIGEDFILRAIRKNYLIRDLFGYQSPLRQEYFYFGRSRLVEGAIDLHRTGQNSALFGLRKSGKTSTIFAIQRRAKTAGYRTLLVDCQDPAIHARRFGALLEYIVSAARRELSLRKIDISLGDTADKISESFRAVMNQSLIEAKTDLLLIFDEIENISPKTAASPHWRDENDSLLFWQTLRSYFQNPAKQKVTFCFVGTNPHLFELPKIADIDNPVYLFAPKTFIPMLSPPETREMITRLGYFMGLDFSDPVISYIHQRFGGHPFFIRQFCSHIHKKLPAKRPIEVSMKVCKETERDAGLDLKGYLDEILTTLKSFYPHEHEMLEFLARGDTATFHEMAAYSQSFVEHLIGYGIVIRRGDDFEFAFDAVAAAVEQNLLQSAKPDLEARRTEISKRRNRLEEEIRSALFRWARKLSDAEWRQAVSSCLTEARKREIGNMTINQAFSRRSSPLNFIETLKFVQRAPELQAEGIQLNEISAAMDLVNKKRVDAHAKDITDEDFRELTRAFELLESVFLAPE